MVFEWRVRATIHNLNAQERRERILVQCDPTVSAFSGLGDQVGLAVRSAPGSLASRVDAFDDDIIMFLLVAVPTIRRQCLHPQCRNVGVARRCRRNLAAFGPEADKTTRSIFSDSGEWKRRTYD